MEGKIFGVPLALILLVLMITAFLGLPMVFMYRAEMKKLNAVSTQLTELGTFVSSQAKVEESTPSLDALKDAIQDVNPAKAEKLAK